MSQSVEKCPTLQCCRIHKKFLNPDPGAVDLQNVISSFSSKDTSLMTFHEEPVNSFHEKLR